MIYFKLLVNLLAGVVFIVIGGHLIVNNKVVTNNLLQNVSLFETKMVKRLEKSISQKKYFFNRFMIYFIGTVFFASGVYLLFRLFS